MKAEPIVFAVAVCVAFAVKADVSMEERRATDVSRARGYAYGAKAKEVFCVVDQDDVPVAGARIYGGFVGGPDVNGFTDKNGVYIAKGRCKDWLSYTFFKEGYYETCGKVQYLDTTSFPAVVSGKWQPYGSRHQIVLKKIKNPRRSAMMPKDRGPEYNIPEYGKWIGFDMAQYDWTCPYGTGKHADVMLKFMTQNGKTMFDFSYVMEVSFTNNLLAGAYVSKRDTSSQLWTAYNADTNALFKTMFTFKKERKPGQAVQIVEFIPRDSYLVYRTRTKVDDHGRLVSAHYGVISGWFSTGNKMLLGETGFNPIANDTNIEDAETARKAALSYKQFLEQLQNEK